MHLSHWLCLVSSSWICSAKNVAIAVRSRLWETILLQLKRIQTHSGSFPSTSEQLFAIEKHLKSLNCSCVASDASFPIDRLELIGELLQFMVYF